MPLRYLLMPYTAVPIPNAAKSEVHILFMDIHLLRDLVIQGDLP
jgi:hypothetical protein